MPRIIITALITIIFATLLTAEERKPHFTQIDESLAVDISTINAQDRDYISNFFKILSRKIKKFFPENKKSSSQDNLPLRILFAQEKEGQRQEIIILPTRKYINIYLPASFLKNPEGNDRLINKLIAAMIVSEGGRIPTDKTATPYWLSIGITENISTHFNNPVGNVFRIYPDLHNLICNGGSLTLSTLITAPPESYSQESTTLFREAAGILIKELSSLKYPKGNPFLEITTLYSKTEVNDPLTAFNKSFRDQILAAEFKTTDNPNNSMTDKEKIEAFFQNRLSRYALNYFMPASLEMSEKAFESLQQIQVSGSTTTPDLAELPNVLQKMNDIKQQEALILELKTNTLKAANSIAPELRPPLNNLRFAIFRFAGKEITPDEFRKSIKDARDEFETKLQALKKTERWLVSLELEHGLSPDPVRNSGIIKKLDSIERDSRPELNSFLDETEKKFGN